MKRNWDLIRQILLRLEAEESATAHLLPQAVDGFDAELVGYHLDLMDQAGLLLAKKTGGSIVALRLTWAGHELLDGIRRDTTWNRVKGVLREKGLDLTVEAVKLAAAAVVQAAF